MLQICIVSSAGILHYMYTNMFCFKLSPFQMVPDMKVGMQAWSSKLLVGTMSLVSFAGCWHPTLQVCKYFFVTSLLPFKWCYIWRYRCKLDHLNLWLAQKVCGALISTEFRCQFLRVSGLIDLWTISLGSIGTMYWFWEQSWPPAAWWVMRRERTFH